MAYIKDKDGVVFYESGLIDWGPGVEPYGGRAHHVIPPDRLDLYPNIGPEVQPVAIS